MSIGFRMAPRSAWSVCAVALLVLSGGGAAADPNTLGGTASSIANGAPLMVETVVGTGEWGVTPDGGLAATARLTFASGLVFDRDGNLYYSDQSNCRVRKVDASTHVVSTIMAEGCNFSGSAAPLLPGDLAFDSHGDLYVDQRVLIRKVSMATGVITTVAGTGEFGFSGNGGPATAARIGANSIAFDADDNLYIAEDFNGRIRKVTAATGTIDTIAGRGNPCSFVEPPPPVVDARTVCTSPRALAFDPAGRLLIVDGLRRVIWRMNLADNTLTRVAGNGTSALAGDGFPATEIGIFAFDLAIDDASNVYFSGSGSLYRISALTGRLSRIAGRSDSGQSGDGGPALNAQLYPAPVLALDPAGNLNFSGNGTIRRLVPSAHDTPLTADMDGDARADLVVWRPGTGTWFWLTSSSRYAYGASAAVPWGFGALGDRPLLADMDGDGKADPVIWRASTGTWYWLQSSSGYNPLAAGSRQWGNADLGDVPLLGDIDGDRKADLIVWRPSDGTWYWLTSSSGFASASAGSRQWGSGALRDTPLVGDIDGDGKVELIVTRLAGPAPNEFSYPLSDYWFCLTSRSRYADHRLVYFGHTGLGERALVADMDGDGRADLVTWDQRSGVWQWLTAATNFQGVPGGRVWGNQNYIDQPLLGDVDGDGKADPMVWRLSTGTWYWLATVGGLKQWGW